MEGQGARPHRPDPGDLRRARPHPRGRAAGRAGASELSEVAAGAELDPPGAAARRLRLSRRPGETQIEADRRALDDRIQRIKTRARQGRAHPRPAPRGAKTRAVSDRCAGRLHQRRKVDAVQPADRRRRRRPRTCCSPRSTRRCGRSSCRAAARIILSDTVGFISELPHQLVAAFRATLEEVLDADLILHVRDISPPRERAPGGERARDPRRARRRADAARRA